MNNNCIRCGHEFSRVELLMACRVCKSRRCNICEPKCKKNECKGTYCEVCFDKGYGNGFCHKCNTQCWVCGIVSYPSYGMETRNVKNMKVVICARHSSRPKEMKIFEDFLTELDKSPENISELDIREDLYVLNQRFE